MGRAGGRGAVGGQHVGAAAGVGSRRVGVNQAPSLMETTPGAMRSVTRAGSRVAPPRVEDADGPRRRSARHRVGRV